MAHHLQQQQQQQQAQHGAHSGQHQLSHRSSDSALAGALGPVSSATFFGDEQNTHAHAAQRQGEAAERNDDEESKNLAMTGGVAAFDYDDMEMDVAPETASSHSYSHSPSSSSASMSNHSSPSSRSGSGSPPAGVNGHANGVRGVAYGVSSASASAVSSPPDTPLLATPISPLSSTFTPSNVNANAFPWAAQAGDGGATPLANASNSSTANNTPTGPSAFDSFHLPAKTAAFNGLGGAFSSFASPAAGMYSSGSAGNTAGLFARKGVQGGAGQGHGQSLYTALRAGAGASGGMMGRGVGMNGYAGYEQFSSELPGALALHPSANGRSHARANGGGGGNGMDMEAIQPELLFGAAYAGGMMRGAQTAPSSEMNTPSTSRAASPTTTTTPAAGSGKRSKSKDSGVPSGVFDSSPLAGPSTTASSSSNAAAALQASTTLSRPGASLLLSKPFKCPKPGCMKSYKQANGLKYHMTHGQCNFNPPPELESLQGLSEREAERRLRPYCCQVAPCQRRYKNMNGLRYHYQHSGEHGAVGLRMLAEGRHDALRCREAEEEEEQGQVRDEETVRVRPEREREREGEGEGAARRRGMKLDTDVANGMPDAPMSAFPSVTATSLAASAAHQRQNSLPSTAGAGAGLVLSPQFKYVPMPMPMQSQPASAYASPWASPRSSPPLTPAAAVQAQAQQMQMQQYQQQQALQAQQQQQQQYEAQQQHFDAQQQQQWTS